MLVLLAHSRRVQDRLLIETNPRSCISALQAIARVCMCCHRTDERVFCSCQIKLCILEGLFKAGLVAVVSDVPCVDEPVLKAPAVLLSQFKSFVLCHCRKLISSSWIRKLVASWSLSFHTLSNHTPWSSGSPITWEAEKPDSCSALTARSHLSCVIGRRFLVIRGQVRATPSMWLGSPCIHSRGLC